MDRSLKEEIEGRIDEVLSQIGPSYTIDFEPSNSDGEGSNSCFAIKFECDSLDEDLYDNVERAIDDSELCSDYDLYSFWRDGDCCICPNGWDVDDDD